MPLLVRCPDCEADNRVAEDLKGQTVACKLCGVSFKVGKDAKLVERTAEEKRKAEEAAAKESRKRKSRRKDLDDDDDDDRPRTRRRDDDDDDDESERPRSRPRGQTSSGMTQGQKTAAGVGGAVVVAAIVGIGIWAATSNKSNSSSGGANNPGQNRPKDQVKGKDGAIPGMQESEFDTMLRGLKASPDRSNAGWFAHQPVNPARKAEVARALDNALKGDQWVAYDALESLKKWGDKDSVPGIVALYQRRPDGPIQDRIVDTLGAIKDSASAQALVDIYKETGGHRGKIAGFLRGMGGAAEKPVAALLNETDAGVKAEACKILAQIGTKQTLPALEQIVEANRPTGKMKGNQLFTEANKAINSITARGL